MTIEASEKVVLIRLSKEEAERVQIDHGAGEICIPCEDTMEAVLDMSTALREVDPFVVDDHCPECGEPESECSCEEEA
ncbi:MAG TPA: hypothetical protein VJ725_21550 [Thermoanaerobaculia bacterium]|nr:hypothetical protein [Thermoanaerobaculia bacterium]